MCLTNEHVGPKILAKIKIYILTRAELLFHLCYEIPCSSNQTLKPFRHYDPNRPLPRIFSHLVIIVWPFLGNRSSPKVACDIMMPNFWPKLAASETIAESAERLLRNMPIE